MICRQLAFSPRAILFNNVTSRTLHRSARLWQTDAKKARHAPLKLNDYTRSGAPKYVYPERLLIWDAGPPKNALIGASKAATVMIFGVALFFAAPQYIFYPDEDSWKAIPAIVIGAVPMAFVALASSPFVGQVRIQLPGAARLSREALLRWAANPPSQTTIVFTTVRLIGSAKHTTLTLGGLRPTKRKIGMANLERVPDETLDKRRSWYARMSRWLKEPANKFFVGGEEGCRRSAMPQTWPLIWKCLQRQGSRR